MNNIVTKNNFDVLIENLSSVHHVFQHNAVNVVNQFLSIRNWVFGYYIVEYEHHGEDRAKYGENLMQEIAKRLTHIKGLRFRQLYICKEFYLTYSHFLRTVSAKLQSIDSNDSKILRTLSAKSLEAVQIRGSVSCELYCEDFPQEEYPLQPQLLLSRLNFSHFIELVRVSDPLQRLFYEVETIKNNWSVRELKRAINTQLALRTTLSTNKEAVIAKIKNLQPASAIEVIRNPYVLEFLGLEEKAEYSESDLEQAIISHLQQFLMELGTGFCFEARQKRITFNNRHYRIDLVCYHRVLKCHVLIDLKLGEFDDADAGQMNLYLNYFKANEMSAGDNPPIGIVLCADKDEALVTYSTAGMDEHLFVSKYMVALPTEEVLVNFIRNEMSKTGELKIKS